MLEKLKNKNVLIGIAGIAILLILTIYIIYTQTNKVNKKTALEIGNEKYEVLNNLYTSNELFNTSSEIFTFDFKYYEEILNYDKLLNDKFTKPGKKEFEKLIKDDIYREDGKIFKEIKTRSKNNIELKVESIKFSKIKYSYKKDNKNYQLILKKDNGIWKIDKFEM